MSPTRDTVITITTIPIIIIMNMIPGLTGQVSIPTIITNTHTHTARAGLSALDLVGAVSVGDILTTAGDTHTMVGGSHLTFGVGEDIIHIMDTDTTAVAAATTPAHIITTATITTHITMVLEITGEPTLMEPEHPMQGDPKALERNMKMHWQ